MRGLDERGVTVLPGHAVEHNNGFLGGFYVRQFRKAAGEGHDGHAHYIDHLMFIHAGKVRVRWRRLDNGASGVAEVEAPNFVPVRGLAFHKIEVLTDAVWYCLFSEAEARAENNMTEANGPIPYMMEMPQEQLDSILEQLAAING